MTGTYWHVTFDCKIVSTRYLINERSRLYIATNLPSREIAEEYILEKLS